MIRAEPAVTSTAAAIVSSILVFTISTGLLRNSIFDLELSKSPTIRTQRQLKNRTGHEAEGW